MSRMRFVNRFFIFFLLATLAIFFQRGGFLNVNGITPNLLLIVFLSLILLRDSITLIVSVYLGLLLSAFFVDPFWLMELSLFGPVVLLIALMRKRFTGNAVLDLMLMTAVFELLFYGALSFLHTSALPLFPLFGELVYTVLLGIPLWFAIQRIEA